MNTDPAIIASIGPPEPGTNPAASFASDIDQRLTLVIATVGVLGILVHLAGIPVFLWIGLPWLALLNVASTVAWIVGWNANRRGDHPTAVTLMTAEALIFTVAAVSLLGFGSGFQYYLLAGVPFTLFNTRWRTRQILGVAALMGLVFVVLNLVATPAPHVYPRPWVERGLYLTNALVAFAAVGLASFHFRRASLRAEEELEALATTDALTGLPNRRRMIEHLERVSAEAVRNESPFAVMILDVDLFKRFNDNYGHEVGDRVLQAVASTLRGRLRRTDPLARWGGEEFVVLLPNTDAEAAARVAETLREAVEAEPIRYRGRELPVTVTLGLAVGRPGDSADAVLGRADDALYQGKAAGRNRVVVATEQSA